MRLIKRYSNRKLYDTVSKGYITLEILEGMVKEGDQVQIMDNDSGEDITAGTLSQIIAERTRKSSVYSPAVFVQLIRKGGGTMFDYGRRMLQLVGDTLYSWEGEVEKHMKKLVSSGELTAEEGQELAKEVEKQRWMSLHKIEQQVEIASQNLWSKFGIPNKEDMEKLQNNIEQLDKLVQMLEQKVNEASKTDRPS